MVFWDKAPVAAIGRVVTIVAHHPIIVHFERIFGHRLAIEVAFAIFNGKVITFINSDTPLTAEMKSKLSQLKSVKEITQVPAEFFGKDYVYPLSENNEWTRSDYGPIFIPNQGSDYY